MNHETSARHRRRREAKKMPVLAESVIMLTTGALFGAMIVLLGLPCP